MVKKMSPKELVLACVTTGVDDNGNSISIPDYAAALRELFAVTEDRENLAGLLQAIHNDNRSYSSWALQVYWLVLSLKRCRPALYEEERLVLGQMCDYALENYDILKRSYQYQYNMPMAETIVTDLRSVDGKDRQHKVYDNL